MNLFEILFFIIYIGIWINWPRQALVWTIVALIGALGGLFIILGISGILASYSIISIILGGMILLRLTSGLISIFKDTPNEITTY